MKVKEEETKIYVLPKLQFLEILNMNNITDDNVDEVFQSAFICINDFKGGFYHNPIFISSHHNVLNLFFDDIEKDLDIFSTNHLETKVFSKEDAKKIINFLEQHYNIKSLLIYCAGGISRSGAVGQFACSFLNANKEHFNNENPHIFPNVRVLRMLNDEITK